MTLTYNLGETVIEVHTEKPSLLFICNEFRYPTETGSQVRISNLIKLYSDKYLVHLIVPRFVSSDPTALDEFYAKFVYNVYVLDGKPEYDSKKRGLLRYLIGPRTVLDFDERPYISAINKLVASKGGFNVIHVERWYMADIVKNDLYKKLWSKSYILDFDGSDYYFRKQLVVLFNGSWFGKLKVFLEPWRVRLWEYRYLSKFDAVFVCSRKELGELERRTGCKNLLFVSNGYALPEIINVNSQTNENILLFVGTLGYGPNSRGFEYFVNSVWPLVRKELPKTEFWHVGKHTKEMIDRHGGKDGVRLLGFVEDISEVYRVATVVVAPILDGAGTRIKLLEAASFGKAIVATEFAAEDLGFSDGLNIVYANSPNDMAEKCVDLLLSPEKRRNLGNYAMKLVREKYTWSKIGSDMNEGLSRLLPSRFDLTLSW
jgi:glycosyltransferase involved in cell wall biosynthesis